MKKTLIALAVAGLSFNAAAVDLNAAVSDAATYASEITLPAKLNDAANKLDVNVQIGFSATANVKRYVRIDLTNAEFETAVVAADVATLALDGGAPAAPIALAPSVSAGGNKGDKFVIVEITPALALKNTDVLVFKLADIKALGGDASVQYRLYETGVAAAAGNSETLAAKSGKLFGFASGLVAKVDTKGAKRLIDVTQESKFFKDETNANVQGLSANEIGSIKIEKAANVYNALGAPIEIADMVNTAKLEVAGNFSAGLKDNDNKLVAGATVFAGIDAADTTVTDSKATFVFDPSANYAGALTFNVDKVTAIEAQDMTVKFVPVAKTGYTMSTVDLGVIGTLAKNGSSAIANLVLAPDTSYTNLVRISNTSGIAGKFFVTAFADDGKSVTFPLSDVAGQPASLAAGASTQQMKVADIYAAAQAKGLALTGDKKLRLKVEGEVGSLSLQNYTVSKDGNALNTMNAF
ncbi:hypothetical protein [Aeromonas veronii]|uniref:hypothetical protein n=1 Tax=Aeromonas veronii TaxID=654 RepID=UPI000B59F9B7|nr:hypothetical protein [Aeromonas veronii]